MKVVGSGTGRRPGLRGLLDRTAALVAGKRLPGPPALPTEAATEGEPATDGERGGTARGPERTARRPLSWLPLDRSLVTLSVEGSSLRMLSVAGEQVTGWTSIPLGDRLARAGQIGDAAGLGAVIDEAFDRLKLSRQRVAWALPGFQVTTGILDLPALQGNDLRDAVAEEAERVLGPAADDAFLFWQRLEGRIRRRTVFVLAVPKPTVLTALETLEAARIRPLTMDLRPLALARAVGRTDAVVANLEEGSLDVVVVAQGVPTVLRSLPLSGLSADPAPAQSCLVEAIDQALGGYDAASLGRPLPAEAAVYLTGQLATGDGLVAKIRSLTNHPVGRLSASLVYPADFPVADYLVNVGLALKRS